MTIPNLITVGRLFLVPLVIVMIVNARWDFAFILFVVAGVSDAIDGFLAKRCGMASELGAWLDPIADKLLMASAYGLLGFLGVLPAWLVLLVIGRDVLIVAAVAAARLQGKALETKPILVSKANTAAQVFLVVLVLADLAFAFAADHVVWAVILVAAALTILSGAAYFNIWMRRMRGVTAP